MDAVLLSRIQFGIAAGFHFIFPSLTLGLTLIIAILETIYYINNDTKYKIISSFIIKILGLVFTLGVATGIVLEFSFGANWAEYSRIVGDIFGPALAAEGIFAFFLESVFLGILLFGRNRVSKKTFLLSAYLVAFASHLSGFWIIIANSWMQTPAGFKMENGRAVLTSFMEASFNPSTLIRFFHVVLSSWIAGPLFLSGISAWNLVNEKRVEYFKPLLKISLLIFSFSSLAMLGSGHVHSVQVARTQPAKMAAFEALWQTQTGAPMSVIGIPIESEEKTLFEISIPKMLSLFIDFRTDSEVKGLNAFPVNDRPPVFISYMSYHIMTSLGMLFIGLSFFSLLLMFFKKLFNYKIFLWLVILSVPLPHAAIQLGWISAETGRQPWVVYNILRTSDAVSKIVPAEHILFTLIMFSLIYLMLSAVFIIILIKIINNGPEDTADQQEIS